LIRPGEESTSVTSKEGEGGGAAWRVPRVSERGRWGPAVGQREGEGRHALPGLGRAAGRNGEEKGCWAAGEKGSKPGGRGELGLGPIGHQAEGEQARAGWFSLFFLFHFNFLFFYFPKHFPKELLSINNLQQKTINKNQICSNMYAQHVSKLMMNFIFHQKLFKC